MGRALSLTLGGVLSFAAVALVAAAEPSKVSQRWGVLVGVDDYAYANDLEFCGADQKALFEQLKKSGFPEENIFLLETKSTDARYQPSRVNIERQLNLVFKLAEEKDLLVVSFSGHGVHIDGKSYLCPADAVLEDPSTLISLDNVYDRLRDCAAPFKLVLVDACRNDPRPGGKRSFEAGDGTRALARSLQQVELPEGVVLLNSCAPGEISWEEQQFGHGVFMHYVLEALQGSADTSGDRAVSLSELSDYVGPKTKAYVARKFGYAQRPFFKGDLSTQALSYSLLPVSGTGSPPPNNASASTVPPPQVVPIPAPPGASGAAKSFNTKINALGMPMVLIPAGEFMMGCDVPAASMASQFGGPPEWYNGESPRHPVVISKSFYMSAHEVTVKQFSDFVVAANYYTEPERDNRGGMGWDGNARGEFNRSPKYNWRAWGADQPLECPVVNVTWNDANAFCAWLTKQEGLTYRLPTEAEWEYACRAGTESDWSFGNDMEQLVRYGNVGDAAVKQRFNTWGMTLAGSDGHVFHAPVGTYAPNPWGLYDMHGNVVEWCSDWCDAAYYKPYRVQDPVGPRFAEERSARGGSWQKPAGNSRSADRLSLSPRQSYNDVGFRVVRQLDSVE